MAKVRILYIDILKLFTIYLVLWGHSIQHFQPDYEKSYIFQTIYAFHMPLFMMLSGYFASSSMSLGFRDFFTKKFRQLLLPCLSWAILCWLIITSGLIEGRFHLDFKGLFAGWLGIVDNFWFLKSCFICYTLAWLCYRCGQYKVVGNWLVWGATLGIYVVQAILLEYLLPRYISFATLPMPVIIMLMPLLSLAMLMITYFIVQLFNRSELLGCLMFGRAYKR